MAQTVQQWIFLLSTFCRSAEVCLILVKTWERVYKKRYLLTGGQLFQAETSIKMFSGVSGVVFNFKISFMWFLHLVLDNKTSIIYILTWSDTTCKTYNSILLECNSFIVRKLGNWKHYVKKHNSVFSDQIPICLKLSGHDFHILALVISIFYPIVQLNYQVIFFFLPYIGCFVLFGFLFWGCLLLLLSLFLVGHRLRFSPYLTLSSHLLCSDLPDQKFSSHAFFPWIWQLSSIHTPNSIKYFSFIRA